MILRWLSRQRKGVQDFTHRLRTLRSIQMPYGLFSIRFFLAYNIEHNRLHRQINFSQRQSYPPIIWAAIQLFLALNWRWRFARRETERAIDQFGQVVYSNEGISLYDQRKVVLRLSFPAKRGFPCFLFCDYPLPCRQTRVVGQSRPIGD